MNKAEEMRNQALNNQVSIVLATIALAVKKGKFECEGDGHLTETTLYKVRSEGFGIKNGSYAFTKFWHAAW
jgi:hypothetical protein